jgi:hypothetical protein
MPHVFGAACKNQTRGFLEELRGFTSVTPALLPTQVRLETELDELHRLKDKNLITEAEFQERQQQLLVRFEAAALEHAGPFA